ncbi:ATP-binding protein [Brevibacillus fluminis]|uniref:sensor histidine kinase n=1 Tax=Brevibacillus fluminis TaxID=511487 RepID=UPI003F8C94F1
MTSTTGGIRKLLRLSLKWRLTLLFVAGMMVLLMILTAFIYWSTSKLVYIHEQHLLDQKAEAIAADLKTQLTEDKYLDANYVKQLLTNYATKQQAIILLDHEGKRLASVIGPDWVTDPLKGLPAQLIGEAPILLDGAHPPLTIRVKQENELLDPYLHILLLMLGVASIVTLVISSFGGYFLARVGLSPLDRLITDIRRIRPSHLSTRLPAHGTSAEINDLVRAFNSLLDRVEEAMKKQQQFIADASHEFRTPLAIIDGYVRLLHRWGKENQAIRDEALIAMDHECSRLFSLIDDMLSLAKFQHMSQIGEDDGKKMQSMVPLLKEIRNVWTSTFPKHLRLSINWTEPIAMAMEPPKIRQLLDILLDNARKYTETGEVTLTATTERGWVHLLVEDTGIGIPEEEMENVFERFYRVDKSRNRHRGGSGLGLPIAKSIVQEYGGRISIRRSASGGTIVHVELPVLARDAD